MVCLIDIKLTKDVGGKNYVCLTMPVFKPFPLKVAFRMSLRPPLNKKSFPVVRLGGIILRLYPAAFFSFSFFFFFFKLNYFSYFSSDFQTVFTIVYRLIRRLHQKKNISKKKKYFPAARVVLFYLTRPTGNDFLLKGGLIVA